MRIEEIYKHAIFADLAYTEWDDRAIGLSIKPDILIELANSSKRAPEIVDGDTIIGPALGTEIFITDGWRVAAHHENHPDTGFSATLFQRGEEQVFAIRGTEVDSFTEAGFDLIQADLHEIGALGFAISQAVSLVNYIRVLQAPLGASVAQLVLRHDETSEPTLPSVSSSFGAFWLESTASATGLGLLDPATPVPVTGHSLGGHLAAIAIRLFPEQFNRAVTFNAPGFDANLGLGDYPGILRALASALTASGLHAVLEILGGVIENGQKLTSEFVDDLFAREPGIDPAPSFEALAEAGRISSFVAEDEDDGDDASFVSSPFVSGEPASEHIVITTEGDSHSMSQIVDALAVQSLLELLDPTIDLDAAGRLLAVVTPRGGRAEEYILNQLSRLYLPSESTAVAEAGVAGVDRWFEPPEPYQNRGPLHERVLALETVIRAAASPRVEIFDHAGAAELVARAAEDIAYRYALYTFTPFAVVGDDSLYTDADAYAFDAHSDAYWLERGTRMVDLVQANLRNSVTADDIPLRVSSGDLDVIEENSGFRYAEVDLRRIPVGLRVPTLDALRGGGGGSIDSVRFGAGIEVLGGGGADRLYGNTFANDIRGGRGADFLDGGRGDDWLYHNAIDGADDDAPDVLAGGPGVDRYFVGDGDTVDDSDGSGDIRIGAGKLPVAGAYRQIAGTVYRNQGLDTLLYRYEDFARLVHFDGPRAVTITLAGYEDGYFGIHLDPPATEEPSGVILIGTAADERIRAGAEISGGPDDDHIEGLAGADDLFGGAGTGGPWGADRFLGGPGADFISSATVFDIESPAENASDAGDFFDGGSGRDVLVGNAGDDQQYGGADADFLSGRSGRDVLHGGPGDDALVGGGGNDLLIGGTGNDFLHGAFDVWVSADRAWSLTPLFDSEGLLVDVTIADAILGDNPPPDDRDVLHGDAGDDFLNGGNGDDRLYGGDDADTLFGWRGNDYLAGQDGPDVLHGDMHELVAPGGEGNDRLDGGAGNDRLFGDAGDDQLDGGTGDDDLHGGAGSDVLRGGAGDDTIAGGADSDALFGGPDNDKLAGGDGDDVLDGGDGDDRLSGGAGHDTHLYRPGEGHDTVLDDAGFDTVVVAFKPDTSLFAATEDGPHLVLDFDAHGSLRLENWARGEIERLVIAGHEFRPGDTIDPSRVAQSPTPSDHDLMFVLSATEGPVHVDGQSGAATIVVPDGVGPDTLGAVVDHTDTLRASISGTPLTIEHWSDAEDVRFLFGDGFEINLYNFDDYIEQLPYVARPLPDRFSVTGLPVEITISRATFEDTERLDLTARLGSGATLPAWLEFDIARGRLSGTPTAANAGSYDIEIVARDPGGNQAVDRFELDIRASLFPGVPVLDPHAVVPASGTWLGPEWPGHAREPSTMPSPVGTTRLEWLDGLGDLNGDGLDDLLVVEYHDDTLAPGSTIRVVFGRSGGFGESFDSTALVRSGDGFDLDIDAVRKSFSGDLNGDGLSDAIIEGSEGGLVVYGQTTPFPDFVGSGSPGVEASFSYRGLVSALGDVDGDGLDDFVFDGRSVLYGQSTPHSGLITIDHHASATPSFYPLVEGEGSADIVHIEVVGDFNGDGVRDFVVREAAGRRLQILFGSAGGLRPGFDFEAARRLHLDGDIDVDISLKELAWGDFNGDGRDDLVLRGYAPAGRFDDLRVVFGTDEAVERIDTDTLNGANGSRVVSNWAIAGAGSAAFGRGVQNVGDINADGIDDIGLSDRAYRVHGGSAYVPFIYGRPGTWDAVIRVDALSASDGFLALAPGLTPGSSHEVQAVALGDIDGDGISNIAIRDIDGERGYIAPGQAEPYPEVVAGTVGDDLLTVVHEDVLVLAESGDDEVHVKSMRGSTVYLGAGDDMVFLDADIVPDSIPLGTTPAAWADEAPHRFIGGAGADRLILDPTKPTSAVFGDAYGPEGNVISLLVGSDTGLFTNRLGSHVLDFGPGRARIHLDDFDPQNVLGGPRSIERLEYADGVTLSYEAIVARGFDVPGTAGDDELEGTNVVDRLAGGSGNDVLTGYGGDDVLAGGSGHDRYVFAIGSGSDLVVDEGGIDRLQWSSGITVDDLGAKREGADLIVSTTHGNEVRIGEWYTGAEKRIEWLDFDSGDSVLIEDWLSPELHPDGATAADPILGSSADDVLNGSPTGDVIHGLSGGDRLFGYDGDDVLRGGGGDDYLNGGAGDDALYSGTGTDRLYGGAGDDLLVAEGGSNRLSGDVGDDHYRIEALFGTQRISDRRGMDHIEISVEGITLADLDFRRQYDHLLIETRNDDGDHTDGSIILEAWYQREQRRIEQLTVAGTTIDAAALDRLAAAMSSFTAPEGGGEPALSDTQAWQSPLLTATVPASVV